MEKPFFDNGKAGSFGVTGCHLPQFPELIQRRHDGFLCFMGHNVFLHESIGEPVLRAFLRSMNLQIVIREIASAPI